MSVYKIIHLGTSAEFSGMVAIGIDAYAVFTLEGVELSLEAKNLMLIQRNGLTTNNIVRAFSDYNSAANEVDLISIYNRIIIRETQQKIEPVCKNEFQIVKVE